MGKRIRPSSRISQELGIEQRTRYEKPTWDSIATLDLRTITEKRMASKQWEQDKSKIEEYFYDLQLESASIRGRVDNEGYIKSEDLYEYKIEGDKLVREGITLQGRRFRNTTDLWTALKIAKKDYLALHKGVYLNMKYGDDIMPLEKTVGTGRSPIQLLTMKERDYEGITQKSVRKAYKYYYDNAKLFISGYDNLYDMVGITMPWLDRDKYWYERKGQRYLRKDERLRNELARLFVENWKDLSHDEISPVAAIIQQRILGASKEFMDLPQGKTISQAVRDLSFDEKKSLMGLKAVDAAVTFAENIEEGVESDIEGYFEILKGIATRRQKPNELSDYAKDMIDNINEDAILQILGSIARKNIGK